MKVSAQVRDLGDDHIRTGGLAPTGHSRGSGVWITTPSNASQQRFPRCWLLPWFTLRPTAAQPPVTSMTAEMGPGSLQAACDGWSPLA